MSNVKIPATGSGDATPTIATETIAGIEFQKVKLIDGTPGSTTPLTTFPVSGTVTATGPLTDAQLRATAVPVSNASLPLPTGAATEATLAAASAKLPTALGSQAAATSLGVTLSTDGPFVTNTGSVTEAAPATDTASSGLNGRLQRIAQRLTSIIALLPAALGAGGGLKVDGSGTALPVSGTVTANAGTGTMTVDTELNAAAALADGAAANVSTATVGAIGLVKNASTVDVQRAVIHGQDTAGTGIAAAGILGEFDDASTATVTENQFAPVRITSRRALLVEGDGPTTATTAGTQVASSATSVTLLASNAARRGFILYNGSTSSCNVLFGTTASATSFSVFMAPGATYEQMGVNVYSGRIDGIWATANGNMQVTEW